MALSHGLVANSRTNVEAQRDLDVQNVNREQDCTMARRNIHNIGADLGAKIEELDVAELQAEIDTDTCTVINNRDRRERIGLGAIPGAVCAPRGMLEFLSNPESP